MKFILKNILLLFVATIALPIAAQESTVSDRDQNLEYMSSKGWEFEVKAGLNFGGAAPLGMPREIRHISSYNPKFNGTIEGTVTKWFGKDRKWGVAAGVKIEEKQMSTKARVKNYHTEIIQDGDRVAGYYTGMNQTDYYSTDLTFPITANYRINNRWKVRAGMFFSYVMDKEFNGYVSDGYLRNGTPIGEKATFENGKTAEYNFDDDLRRFNWGVQIGGTWNAYKHFFIMGDLTYAFNNIFKSDFHTVTFTLHPIYLNIGFGYRF